MSELWVKKSPTDIHRLIDNKLPPGNKCTGVSMTSLDEGMVEEYVATINGQEVIVQGPAEESADDVAAALVELAPPPPEPSQPAQETVALEGDDQPTETQAETEEYEYDDSDEDDEDEPADQEWGTEVKPKKPKSKTKKKK